MELDELKRWWDFEICPQAIAQKTLETAGYDNFNKIWVLNSRLRVNPYNGRTELTIDWLTVAYYLEQKGVFKSVNVVEARDKAREYYRGLTTIPEETVIKE